MFSLWHICAVSQCKTYIHAVATFVIDWHAYNNRHILKVISGLKMSNSLHSKLFSQLVRNNFKKNHRKYTETYTSVLNCARAHHLMSIPQNIRYEKSIFS